MDKDMIIQNKIDSVIEELEDELGIVIMVDWWDYKENEDGR